MAPEPEYPEHDKLHEVVERSQAIGEFLDQGPYTLCESDESGFWPVRKPLSTVLAEWFGIDQDKLEAEKRAMLDAHREANKQS